MARLPKNLMSDSRVRFVLVGGFNTALDFGIMNALMMIGLPQLVANTISTGISMVSSFLLNKKWTFRAKGKNYKREVALFFIFTIIGIWIIQNGVIWLLGNIVPTFGLPDWIYRNALKLIASVPSLIWNYVTYRKIVFRKK
ncbi:MAG: GtrA family protein [Candidatus Nomurabacteria bacterium]|jgi:putative flippase GtrA|nr:GtrA family protein [Candidatus Nomurabacteria bacterium]